MGSFVSMQMKQDVQDWFSNKIYTDFQSVEQTWGHVQYCGGLNSVMCLRKPHLTCHALLSFLYYASDSTVHQAVTQLNVAQ